jgi:hypothetical protein
MSALADLGRKPAHVTADERHAAWFAALVDRLMNACDLVIAGTQYRFTELEAYYRGGAHPDLFAHRAPVQREAGQWYFHRPGRASGEQRETNYAAGSVNSISLTCGSSADTTSTM